MYNKIGVNDKSRLVLEKKGMNNVLHFLNDWLTSDKFLIGLFLGLLITLKKIVETLKWYYDELFTQTLDVYPKIVHDLSTQESRLEITVVNKKDLENTFVTRKVYISLCFRYRSRYGGLQSFYLAEPLITEKKSDLDRLSKEGSTGFITYVFTDEFIRIIKDRFEDQKIMNIYVQVMVQPDNPKRTPKISETYIRKGLGNLSFPWIGHDTVRFFQYVNHELSEEQKNAIINSQEKEANED